MDAEHLEITSPDGTRIAAALFDAGAGPAVLVVHGYQSCGDNHHDFARLLAEQGITAMALDLRGHGSSGGALDLGAIDDVGAALAELADRGCAPLGLRGSSLGGFLSVLAAARDPRVQAVVALATPRAEALAGRFEMDWPQELDLDAAARADGPARLYIHARGDEVVPWGHSAWLAGISPDPVRLRVEMGGTHTSLQHDPGIQALSADFLAEHLGS